MTKQTWRTEKLRSANKRRSAHQLVAHCAQLLRVTKQTHESTVEKPSSDCSFGHGLSIFSICWEVTLTMVAVSQAIVAYIYSDGYGESTYADILLGGIGFALVFALIAWWLRPEYKFLNPWVIYDLSIIGAIVVATMELYDAWQDPAAIIMNVINVLIATAAGVLGWSFVD